MSELEERVEILELIVAKLVEGFGPKRNPRVTAREFLAEGYEVLKVKEMT